MDEIRGTSIPAITLRKLRTHIQKYHISDMIIRVEKIRGDFLFCHFLFFSFLVDSRDKRKFLLMYNGVPVSKTSTLDKEKLLSFCHNKSCWLVGIVVESSMTKLCFLIYNVWLLPWSNNFYPWPLILFFVSNFHWKFVWNIRLPFNTMLIGNNTKPAKQTASPMFSLFSFPFLSS